MKGLVFSPGQFPVDRLGATAVVARNLFSDHSSELCGAIIGMGRYVRDAMTSQAYKQVDLYPQYLRKILIHRVISKMCRLCFSAYPMPTVMQQWIEERPDIIADKLAAEQLPILLHYNLGISVALGYTGLSLLFGRAAKSAGLRYVVHSQFCHPNVQNRLLAEAYRSIGLRPPPVSQSRHCRQLATLELADLIWCPSEFVRRSHLMNGVSAEKTFVSYLGVDVDYFHVPKDSRAPDDPFLILFVGNVGVQKGIHVLLEALKIAPIANMSMVFNGVADETAKRLINEYCNHLTPKGITVLVDPGDPRRYHKKASLFVLPSVHDAFGIVVIEAMAAGLPVIVSDHAGANEIIQHDKNGFIFPSGNARKLAELIGLFYNNFEMQRQFGDVSRQISKNYSLKNSRSKLAHHLGLFG